MSDEKINSKYHPVRIWLHWISAVVMIWAIVSGFYSAYGNNAPGVKSFISFFNVSLTTLYLPFFIFRVVAALTLHAPVSHLSSKKIEQLMAVIMHFMLYAVTAIVMVTGVLMMKENINVFNLFTIPHLLSDAKAILFFFKVHITSCVLLAFLVTGHVLAVISHILSGKKILSRMS